MSCVVLAHVSKAVAGTTCYHVIRRVIYTCRTRATRTMSPNSGGEGERTNDSSVSATRKNFATSKRASLILAVELRLVYVDRRGRRDKIIIIIIIIIADRLACGKT